MTRRTPKQIGTDTETMAVRFLREDGWPDADRQPLRGNRDAGDLLVCREPLIIAEVKGGRQAENATQATVVRWLEETVAERRNAGARLAVLVVRRFRRPPALWDAWMPGTSWLNLSLLDDWPRGDAPWPLRSSLADWSSAALAWARRTTGAT